MTPCMSSMLAVDFTYQYFGAGDLVHITGYSSVWLYMSANGHSCTSRSNANSYVQDEIKKGLFKSTFVL